MRHAELESVSSFSAITFALCVVYGLVVPTALHPSWLLEAILPGFKWLSLGSFVLWVIETALCGSWAGLLFSALYNYFDPRDVPGADLRVGVAGAPRRGRSAGDVR